MMIYGQGHKKRAIMIKTLVFGTAVINKTCSTRIVLLYVANLTFKTKDKIPFN